MSHPGFADFDPETIDLLPRGQARRLRNARTSKEPRRAAPDNSEWR